MKGSKNKSKSKSQSTAPYPPSTTSSSSKRRRRRRKKHPDDSVPITSVEVTYDPGSPEVISDVPRVKTRQTRPASSSRACSATPATRGRAPERPLSKVTSAPSAQPPPSLLTSSQSSSSQKGTANRNGSTSAPGTDRQRSRSPRSRPTPLTSSTPKKGSFAHPVAPPKKRFPSESPETPSSKRCHVSDLARAVLARSPDVPRLSPGYMRSGVRSDDEVDETGYQTDRDEPGPNRLLASIDPDLLDRPRLRKRASTLSASAKVKLWDDSLSDASLLELLSSAKDFRDQDTAISSSS